jgi:hypothetical protein
LTVPAPLWAQDDRDVEVLVEPGEQISVPADNRPAASSPWIDELCRCATPPHENTDHDGRLVIVVDAGSGLFDECGNQDSQKWAILQWGLFDLLDGVCSDTPLAVVVASDKMRILHRLSRISASERWRVRRDVMALRPMDSRTGMAAVPAELQKLFDATGPAPAKQHANHVVLLTAGGAGFTAPQFAGLVKKHRPHLYVIGVRTNRADRTGLEVLAREAGGTAAFVQSSAEYSTVLPAVLTGLGTGDSPESASAQKLREALDACCRDKERLCCELRQREAVLVEVRNSLQINLKMAEEFAKVIVTIEALIKEYLQTGPGKGGKPNDDDCTKFSIKLDGLKLEWNNHVEKYFGLIKLETNALKIEVANIDVRIARIEERLKAIEELDRKLTILIDRPGGSPGGSRSDSHLAFWQFWLGLIGGLLAIARFLFVYNRARRERFEEFVWKKTEKAKSLIDEMLADPRCRDALRMIDWDGREFEIAEHRKNVVITRRILIEALKPCSERSQSEYSDTEIYIRDCFDALLDRFATLDQFIRNGLIRFEDVMFPIEYYLEKISLDDDLKLVFARHVVMFASSLSFSFMARFGFWDTKWDEGRASSRPVTGCVQHWLEIQIDKAGHPCLVHHPRGHSHPAPAGNVLYEKIDEKEWLEFECEPRLGWSAKIERIEKLSPVQK